MMLKKHFCASIFFNLFILYCLSIAQGEPLKDTINTTSVVLRKQNLFPDTLSLSFSIKAPIDNQANELSISEALFYQMHKKKQSRQGTYTKTILMFNEANFESSETAFPQNNTNNDFPNNQFRGNSTFDGKPLFFVAGICASFALYSFLTMDGDISTIGQSSRNRERFTYSVTFLSVGIISVVQAIRFAKIHNRWDERYQIHTK